MKNRGQVQLGESTAVVIIVIILLVLGIVFWNRVSSSNIQEIQSQYQELSVIEIANMVSEMSELKCYEASVNKVKCLDWYKILAMSNMTNNKTDPATFLYYNYYFKNSKITIVQIYPDSRNVTLYDAKLSNHTRSLLIPLPINIRDYVNKTTYYGLIMVEGYYNN